MKPIVHSHSALKRYETCPWQYYQMTVTKNVKDVQSQAGAYGEAMHKAIELRVADGTPLPPNFVHHEKLAEFISQIPGEKHAELKLGITRDLEPCEFWDELCWFRGIVDLVILRDEHSIVIDYKTGKYRGGDGQAERCAALVFAHFPGVQTVDSRFIYFKDKHLAKDTFVREDMSALLQPTNAVVADIEHSLANNSWPKKPNGLCRKWCAVKSCPHNGG
jgi:hypothetical protein